MNSSSSPNVSLNKASTSPKSLPKINAKLLPPKSPSATKVNEKGDAGLGKFEIRRREPASTRQSSALVRRQRSAPTLPAASKADQTKRSTDKGIGSAREKNEPTVSTAVSLPPLQKPEDPPTTPCDAKASSSVESTDSSKPICEGLAKDPKLKALCVALGINQSPDTLIGPIEKGQLIIGILQDTLDELIKFKVKSAERKGRKFHIQQSGLDAAVRALENAERSLKTIKESKTPVLGRARYQQSAESIPQEQLRIAEAVIRILTTTKEKFDRMGNGMDKLMRTVSFVSFVSSAAASQSSKYGTPLVKTASSATVLPSSVPNSKRTTAISFLTTTVPATPLNTAAYSRARTSTSAISVGSRCANKANPIPVV